MDEEEKTFFDKKTKDRKDFLEQKANELKKILIEYFLNSGVAKDRIARMVVLEVTVRKLIEENYV